MSELLPSLVLDSAIPGDSKITVAWHLDNDTDYTAVAMKFYINDTNNNNQTPGNYSYNSSLKWAEFVVPSYLIKNNSFDITNLTNGTKYVLYGFAVFRKSDGTFKNDSSNVLGTNTEPIVPTAAPPALIIDDGKLDENNGAISSNSALYRTGYIGALTTSGTAFNVKIVMNNFYKSDGTLDSSKVPDSILVMAKDSSLNTSNTMQFIIPWSEIDTNIIKYNSSGAEIDSNNAPVSGATGANGPFDILTPNYKIRSKPTTINNVTTTTYYFLYTITGLTPNLSYEVSGFPIKGVTIGTLSNTILATATQKSTPPSAPTFVFDYDDGNVEVSTTISERGSISDFYHINLYKRTLKSGATNITDPASYDYTLIQKNPETDKVFINGSETPTLFTFNLSDNFNEVGNATPMDFTGPNGYTFKFNTIKTNNANLFDPLDPNQTFFSFGEINDICFTVNNSFGETDKLNISFSKFAPHKRVSAPKLSIDTIGAETIKLIVANKDVNNQDIDFYGQTGENGTPGYKYRFYNKPYADDRYNFVEKDTKDPGQSNYTFGGYMQGARYSFDVSIAIENKNYQYNSLYSVTEPQYIESIVIENDTINATMYGPPGAPTSFEISYLEADVNGQAKLSWTSPSADNRSNLPVVNYKIYRKLSSDSSYGSTPLATIGTDTTYTDTTAINGTIYNYAVAAVTSTAGTNSITATTVEGEKTESKTIVPWSRPNAATLSMPIAVGNHWARMVITNNALSTNGLNAYFHRYEVENTNSSVSVPLRTDEDSSFYFTGLPNDVVNTFKPFVSYSNPNVSGSYIRSADPTGYTATPKFESISDFQPSSLLISNVISNGVTVSWTAPTFVTDPSSTDTPDNVTLNGYKVEVYLSTDLNSAVYTSSLTSNTTLNITDAALINGKTYVAKVIAYYDDSTTTVTVEQLGQSSVASETFIPVTNPNPPTNVTYDPLVFGTTGNVKVEWTAPTDTQGSGVNGNDNIPISGYSIYYNQYSYSDTSTTPYYSTVSNPTIITGTTTNYTFTDLANGYKYQFFVQTQILDPNTQSALYSNTATNTTKAVPFDNTTSLYSVNGFDISSISESSIGVRWNRNTSLFGLPFDYILETRIPVSDTDTTTLWSLLETIPSTPVTTNYTHNNLTKGSKHEYRIRIEMSNPNGGDKLVGNNSHVEDAIPYVTPGAPTDLTATAGNTSIALSWNPAPDNGLPVLGYNVYQVGSPNVKVNGSTLVDGTSYTHTGRTNGTLYSYVVTVVTDNINNDAPDDPTSGTTIESGASNTASATPYTTPSEPLSVNIDTDVPTQGSDGKGINNISWSAPSSDGGFDIAGYNVYQVGSSNALNGSTLVTSTSYAHTGLTYGQSYSYFVKAVVLNANAGDAREEGASSDTVSKIPFYYANAAILSYTETNETDIVLNWTFTDNTTAVGFITGDKFFNINVTNNSQPELSYVVPNVSITLGTKEFHNTPGNRYSIAIETVFSNPNPNSGLDLVTTVSSALPVTTFGYADVHLDLIETDLTSITIAMNQLNDIDLKGGYFINYHGFVYEMNANNTHSSTPVKTFTSNDQISYQTITGLTQYKRYKIVVQVETGRDGFPNDRHRGDNTYVLAQTVPPPTNSNRPSVLGVNGSGSTLEVQSSITSIKYVIVAITADYSTASNKQLFYYIADPDVTGANNIINISLSNITYAQIKDVNVFLYNQTNGLSNVYTRTINSSAPM